MGLRYGIAQSDALGDFFNTLEARFAEYVPEVETVDVQTARSRFDPGFTLYQDPNKAGITVIERRTNGAAAAKRRQRWTMHDAGRLRGEIEDGLAVLRYKYDAKREEQGLQAGALTLKLSEVIVVGDERSRKLGLKAADKDPATKFMQAAHGLVNGILGTEIKRPESTTVGVPEQVYTPKLMFGRINRRASQGQFEECVAAAREVMAAGYLAVDLTEPQIFDYSYSRQAA